MPTSASSTDSGRAAAAADDVAAAKASNHSSASLDDVVAKASRGDKAYSSMPLLAGAAIFALLAVGLYVVTGLAASCNLGSSCTISDISPTRSNNNFKTVPFLVPTRYLIASVATGVTAMAVMAIYAWAVIRQDVGTPRMVEIATYIAEGSRQFLIVEYAALIPLVIVLFVLIGFAQSWATAGAYVIGAVTSASTGWIGMSIATRGNVRTTSACMNGLSEGLNVAFRSGAVMGLSVVSGGLTAYVLPFEGSFLWWSYPSTCTNVFIFWFCPRLSATYLIFRDVRALAGFSAGASTIALFARVGGGIYTKAADVGADLVGKVEASIPEGKFIVEHFYFSIIFEVCAFTIILKFFFMLTLFLLSFHRR